MFEGKVFNVGDEVIAWDDDAQEPAHAVVIGIDDLRHLYAVRILTDAINIIQPTTFECIAGLNP